MRLVVVVAAICDRTPPPPRPATSLRLPSPSLEAAVGHHAHSGGLKLIFKHLNLQGGDAGRCMCGGGGSRGIQYARGLSTGALS